MMQAKTWTTAALILASATVMANAQNQRLGSANILSLRNITSIIEPAFCRYAAARAGKSRERYGACNPDWKFNGTDCEQCTPGLWPPKK